MGIGRAGLSSLPTEIVLLLSTTAQWPVSSRRLLVSCPRHAFRVRRCNELQILLDRIKPVNGSVASLYEQVEEHVRPWIKIVDGVQDDQTDRAPAPISLHKLKQSLAKLLLEQN